MFFYFTEASRERNVINTQQFKEEDFIRKGGCLKSRFYHHSPPSRRREIRVTNDFLNSLLITHLFQVTTVI